ncbi:Unconventional myosin-VIIb [Saguinus oedipus]|uniref:Unconventional myosin-VIIb n=1 Tax=Saguinus oedipus TaxID=9490 RepID=A0ABQ9VJ69_SAGOE|nr:Unconventional myosin-VIIb [Saguinus oedipus]
MLEVGANTRVRDVCDSVATRLQLASWEGCSLFIKIADKVISQKEGDYFFDSLRQVSDWVKKNKPQKEGEEASVEPGGGVAGWGAPVTLPYQVYFMRKLWLNVAPGKDVNSDTILHYHQHDLRRVGQKVLQPMEQWPRPAGPTTWVEQPITPTQMSGGPALTQVTPAA